MPAVKGGHSTVWLALVQEIKHHAYRLMVRRDLRAIRPFTRNVL